MNNEYDELRRVWQSAFTDEAKSLLDTSNAAT